jgi:hypothetical protein
LQIFPHMDIVTSQTKGRCFYTKDSTKKGEVVLQAQPFGMIVDQESVERVCAFCVKEPLSLNQKLSITCKYCSQVYYSSEKCRDDDWEAYHRYECGFTLPSTLSSYEKDYLRLLIRVLIKWKTEPFHPDLKHVQSLCHNIASLNNDQVKEFKRGAEILFRFISKIDLDLPKVNNSISELIQLRLPMPYEYEALFLLIAQEESNSFGLYTFNYLGNQFPRQGFGLALYPTAVYFNHSCAPNIGHYLKDHTMEFFALEDIHAQHECMISYVQLNTDRVSRRKILKELFYFDCLCKLCIGQDVGMVAGGSCMKDSCKGYLIPRQGMWNCVGCGSGITL